VSHDLATKSAATGSITVRNMDDLARLGNMLASSGYFTDARDAAQCGVKVLAGLEMGFGAFASMSGIHLISGKPAIGANLMAARVKASGKYDYKVRELTPAVCHLEFFQGSESLGPSVFTIEDARKAGTKNLDKFPRNMLFARALSNGVRWYCPDVFLGSTVYTPEELGADVNEDGDLITVPASRRQEPVEAPRPALTDSEPHSEPDGPSVALATPAQLKKLAIHMKQYGRVEPDTARALIGWVLGRELASAKELTKEEASRVLDWDQGAWDAARADFIEAQAVAHDVQEVAQEIF
jgi:hypothetical protein